MPTMHDFQLALDRGDFARAEEMAGDLAGPGCKGEHGRTALHFALLHRGSGRVVESLLAHGEDVNAQSSDGTPPLFLAARRNEPAMVQRLLDAGADISCRDGSGAGVLHYAESASVALLCAHGADIEARDAQGRTPLHQAALYEDPATIAALLACGADKETRDAQGKSPLEYALASEDAECIALLQGAQS